MGLALKKSLSRGSKELASLGGNGWRSWPRNKTPLRNGGSWASPQLVGTESLEGRCLLPVTGIDCPRSSAFGVGALGSSPGLSTLSQAFKEVGANERRLNFPLRLEISFIWKITMKTFVPQDVQVIKKCIYGPPLISFNNTKHNIGIFGR